MMTPTASSSLKSVRFIGSCLRSAILSSYKLLAISLVALYGWGCQHTSEPAEPRLCMEAWIDSDGYPVVILTQSIAPGADGTALSEAVVRWAKVTISDGDGTVVMTGGVDYSVFPPFSYRSYAMQGEVGKTYTITAEYHGMRATATATILPPPTIDGIEMHQSDDGAYHGTLDFTAPDTADTCTYVLFTRVRNAESRHYPSMLGSARSTAPLQQCQAPLYRSKHADSLTDFSPSFAAGDTLDVILARVEPQVYDFWQGYSNAVYFGNNLFISTSTSPAGNVDGGYGIFSARGVARRVLVVSPDHL